MHWIAVHEEVLGSKLRGLHKSIGCSAAEALGILTVLWLWSRKNADITGLLGNADREDIAAAIRPSLNNSLDAITVTDALIEGGWIDEVDGNLYVHDWYEWQQYWYNYLDKKEKDKLRKRLERERQKESHPTEPEEKPVASKPPENGNGEKSKDEKPTKPTKIKYAESVSMYEGEHQKLVDQYGAEFTEKLVYELNNYKLANGKKYKDDYRAILNWVVEKCEQKYRNLKVSHERTIHRNDNPFADYK